MSIDRNIIIASMTDDPDTIAECAGEFVPFARADLAAIGAAARVGDAAALWQVSHRLKGGAALFGARALQQACSDLESAANGSDWKTIGAVAPTLEPLLAAVEQALAVFIKHLRTGSSSSHHAD